jgi:cyclohexyl-isocyanide hydratase
MSPVIGADPAAGRGGDLGDFGLHRFADPGGGGAAEGPRAACHWAWRDQLALFGAIPDPARVVRDGRYVTGGGVTAGIDFALTLAAEIAGDDFAQGLQLALEYAPAPPFNSGRPRRRRRTCSPSSRRSTTAMAERVDAGGRR